MSAQRKVALPPIGGERVRPRPLVVAAAAAAIAGSLAALVIRWAERPDTAPPPTPPPAHVVALHSRLAPPPTPAPTPPPTPEPTAAPPPPAQRGQVVSGGRPVAQAPPAYPIVFHLDAPSVGIHVPVASVGVTSRGAMDAPEGPLSSAFWREGFWLRGGAVPGSAGTATIAGHLDDTSGRAAAFWTLRNIHTGDAVTVTVLSSNQTIRYRITEVVVYTTGEANSPAVLARIYGGGSSDGASHLTLITCTGRFVHGEYDHRFVAYGVMEG